MAWEWKTLDQLGSVSRGRSKHRPRDDESLYGGIYPFIQTADVKRSNFYITEYSQTYNERGLAQSKLWRAGTLCFTIAANIADSAILGIDACFPDSIMGFIPYEGVSDVRFVKYCFDVLQQQCKQISQGATQDNLSWEKLSTIKFPAPDYKTQQKIADILSAYDDLIENNQKQIKLLEEAAQRLYKQWFIDLRYPGHEITPIVDGLPEGWRKEKLGNVIEYIRGTSYTSSELSDSDGVLMVNLKNINAFGGYKRNAEKRFTGKYKENGILEQGDLVMGCTDMTKERRLVGHVALIPNLKERAVFTMDLLKLLPKRISKTFLYAQCRFGGLSYKISPLANGANVLHLRPENMADIEVLCPAKSIVEMYDNVFASMISKIEKLEDQIQLASESRNRLLPKLMNGELEV